MNALMSAHVAKTNAFTTWSYIDPDRLVTFKVHFLGLGSLRFMHMFLPLQRNVTRNVLKLTSLFAVRMGLRIPTNVTSNTRRAFTRRKSLSGTKVNVKFKMTAVLAPKTTSPSVALIM